MVARVITALPEGKEEHMTDVVEVMARAVELHEGLSANFWEDHVLIARAALAALNEAGYVVVPREPTPEMLACIVHKKYPEDWERGIDLQKLQLKERRERTVPFKCEYEIAVGQYERLLSAAQPAPK